MGNQSYVSSPRNLVADDVDAQLREINERRFGGLFTIKRLDGDGWSFEWKDFPERPCWVFRMEPSKRKIGGRHPIPLQWITWAWAVFQNELGAAWHGRISDDGAEGTWEPIKDKFPTFPDWQAMWHQHSVLPEENMKQWSQYEVSEIPEAFKPYALPKGEGG